MEEGSFDVVIIGTGLTESICAAALSKAGLKVAHIDENPYYGGDEASLSLDELVLWADTRTSGNDPCFTSVSHSSELLPDSRQYSICLCPSIIPSIGPLISSLVASGVAKYGGFRLLEHVGMYNAPGVVKTVPGSKEDVFKNKDIALPDKRRLMRFLMFAVGAFEDSIELQGKNDLPFSDFLKTVFALNDDMTLTIAYSLAHCVDSSDRTRPALERARKYLRSTGRYGPSPFLVGHYGGAGDISQGFCRAAAVSGGVYILGRRILSISNLQTVATGKQGSNVSESSSVPKRGDTYNIQLDDFPEPIHCDLILSSSSYSLRFSSARYNPLSSPQHIARCIAITDHPIAVENATLSNLTAGGEGTLSAPKGRWIIYISLPLVSEPVSMSGEALLRPYLEATMKLSIPSSSSAPSPSPLFTLFYIHHPLGSVTSEGPSPSTSQSTTGSFPKVLDAAATNAETMFWKIVKALRPDSQAEGGNGEIIQDFWPPQIDPQVGDEDEDEW
ncbi:GDP dissociation inhibitor-domain-containing protein [Infundibulicybe gibba]|nr:GDP dissociation inhibitor-domain-containing protein [Infundibulicybe gibba]